MTRWNDINYITYNNLFDRGSVANYNASANATDFTGTSTTIAGINQVIKTVSFWLKRTNTTGPTSIVELYALATSPFTIKGVVLNATNDEISTVGFTAPNIYVDGIKTNELNDSNWHFITITDTTGEQWTSTAKVGIHTNYISNFYLSDLRLYSIELNNTEVVELYNYYTTTVTTSTTTTRKMVKYDNIQIFKNTFKQLNFIMKDNYGEIIDLTNSTGRITVFLDIPGENSTAVLQKSLTLTEATHGECKVDVSEDDSDLDCYLYKYIIEFDFGDGWEVLYYGVFEIVGDDNTRINEIKTKYGLQYDYYVLKEALDYAHKEMLNNAFTSEKIQFNGKKEVIEIDNYVMDSNFDGIVDKDDISILEFLPITPFTIHDLSNHISSIIFDHPNELTMITMDTEYPTDGYTVKIEYSMGCDTHANLVESIRLLEEYYTVYHLFTILPIYKLQRGITNQTINGVSIEYNQEGIEKFKTVLFNMINNLIMKIRPFKFKSVQINKGYGELINNDYIIRTPRGYRW